MPAADQVSTEVLPTHALPPSVWDEIWTLTSEFYDVDREYAEMELRRCGRIALFRMNGALLGMAAIDTYPTTFRGRAIVVISTTHVLIRENWRGRNLVQRLGFRSFLAARRRHPLRPVYWFFDTFSYKSYLLLPRNFVDYWPRRERPTPAKQAALIDQLATAAYGPAWQPERGIVIRGAKRLRASTAPLPDGDDRNPDVAFFARANPGHAQGDMLVCLCPLTLRNWLSLARALLRRRRRTAQ